MDWSRSLCSDLRLTWVATAVCDLCDLGLTWVAAVMCDLGLTWVAVVMCDLRLTWVAAAMCDLCDLGLTWVAAAVCDLGLTWVAAVMRVHQVDGRQSEVAPLQLPQDARHGGVMSVQLHLTGEWREPSLTADSAEGTVTDC